MENKNQVATTNNQPANTQPKFSVFMKTVGSKLVSNTITDEKRKVQFIANIVSAVSNNPTLQECDQTSVVSAALQAESLHFPINNALGYCYLVPYNDKNSTLKKAQFQIGYKGYIQLAIRSGQYKDINVVEVKEGEIGAFDPLNGQSFNWIPNYLERKKLKTIGYVGQLELINGFKKQLYISFDEMLDHADTYSQAFSKDATTKKIKNREYKLVSYEDYAAGKYNPNDEWLYSSFWYKSFDEMAKKTVIRQLLSKWGIMSVEMTEAFVKDQAEMKADGSYDYIDSKEFESTNVEEVKEAQEEKTASVKVNAESGEVIEEKTQPTQEEIFEKHVNQDWMK